jgi:hypothetical protein
LPEPRGTPRDFGELGRRISSRTTDLLAIGILLTGGIAVGGSLMNWWRAEPPAPVIPVAPPAPWDDPSGVELDFGEGDWSIRREPLAGTVDAAHDALVERVRSVAASASGQTLPAADDAELKLIEQLQHWSPHEVHEAARVYAIGGPLFWVVGTCDVDGGGGDAGVAERVVCWGLALPQANDSWTLYVMNRRVPDHTDSGSAEITLPDGAARSMRIASDGGGELTCFSGDGPVDHWIAEFDATMSDQGWTREDRWRRSDHFAAAAYRRGNEVAAEFAAITLLQDEDGVWRGVIDLRRQ